MGTYQFDQGSANRKKPVHPVWRGIGCLLLLIVPVFSYALADVLVHFGVSEGWRFIPRALLGYPRLPDLLRQFNFTRNMFGWITRIPNFYANLLAAVIIAALLFGLIGTVYAIAYGATGPARYGPYDIPPPKYKPKKYKR